MRNIAAHDDGAAQGQAGGYRVLRQLLEDLGHRAVKVNLDCLALTGLTQLLRDEFARIMLQLLQPDAVTVDLAFNVTVSGAGNPHSHRAGCAMARQTHHANVMRKVFTAKLRAQSQVLRFFQQLFFQRHVAECLTVLIAFGRQAIIVLGRRQFYGFQGCFRRGAADNERHVVRRASRGAQRTHFLDQIILQLARRQQRFGFLIKVGFVGRTAAFSNTQEFVFFTVDAVEVDLRRQVAAGVDLFIHIQRGVLRIAQVVFDKGVVHPA
ncbi:hypothetical protein D3C71_1390750 [compost metagenome]